MQAVRQLMALDAGLGTGLINIWPVGDSARPHLFVPCADRRRNVRIMAGRAESAMQERDAGTACTLDRAWFISGC